MHNGRTQGPRRTRHPRDRHRHHGPRRRGGIRIGCCIPFLIFVGSVGAIIALVV